MAIALFIVLAGILAVGLGLAYRTVKGVLEQRLGGLEDKLESRLGGIEVKVDRRLEGLDGRLLSTQQNAGQAATQIVEQLTKLDGTAAQMLQQAGNLSKLEQALRPPKARGGFGEILLGKLLADSL